MFTEQAADHQAKKLKIEDEPAKGSSDSGILPAVLSEALAKFFGTGEKEMLRSEALERVWEYIKVNQLEVSILIFMLKTVKTFYNYSILCLNVKLQYLTWILFSWFSALVGSIKSHGSPL